MNFVKPKVKAPAPELIGKTKNILDRYKTDTICLESACPNIAECFARGTATFLILGDVCTRRCHFCNVAHGKPKDVDESEPVRVASAVEDMGLKYVVVTSVDRDDLADFGAMQFVKVCQAIKERTEAKVELLTPDFKAKKELLDRIIQAGADKLAHNIETVERLSKKIMPGCSYTKSLDVLEHYAKSGIVTKSSIMVGLGEEWQEIERTLEDLRNVGVRQLTIGQYLAPSPAHAPVVRYYSSKEFEELRQMAFNIGFEAVVSGTLVRSSYYAERI